MPISSIYGLKVDDLPKTDLAKGKAVERLMGLILTAIAVEMLLGGVREFVQGLK